MLHIELLTFIQFHLKANATLNKRTKLKKCIRFKIYSEPSLNGHFPKPDVPQ